MRETSIRTRGYAIVGMTLFLCVISAGLPLLHQRLSLVIDLETQLARETARIRYEDFAVTGTAQLLECRVPPPRPRPCTISTRMADRDYHFSVQFQSHRRSEWWVRLRPQRFRPRDLRSCYQVLTEERG